MMSSWRRSRLVWSFCFLEYLLCHVSDSLNLESFEEKKREALQELKFSFRGSSKQPEKYIYRDRQPSLDSKSETCTHCEGLEKFNRGVDSSYLNLRGDSKDENIIHDEKNVKSQLSQWESIQFSFSYLEEELKYWRIFSQNLPKNFVKERVALEPLFYDFDKIYVLNSCMKKEIKKRSHMASAGELFATSIHGIPEIENAIYEKILTDLIEFIFEKKTELDKGVYYPLKTNYLAGLFNFLNHWKLIPPNLLETFQLKISSQFGIKWISQRILEGLNLKATISVNFPANFILFHVKGYFENHFFLGYIDRFLNYLKIPEINLVWLYVMKKTLLIKLNKFPHASRVNPYHQISHIQRLVLSIFENTEIQLLKQTTIKSDDMNALDIPIKLREDISKLKSFISNPAFEYNESLMGSYENTYEILIGSALFMNYLYENFYKNSSRDDITFSPVFLSTLKVLKAKVTVDLWTSTLVHLYSFFYVHHKHLLGVKENDFEERKILYLRRMEDYQKENFEKLMNELKNDSKNKKLFKENIYYRLRSPVYMGKGPLQELEELPQTFLDFAN